MQISHEVSERNFLKCYPQSEFWKINFLTNRFFFDKAQLNPRGSLAREKSNNIIGIIILDFILLKAEIQS